MRILVLGSGGREHAVFLRLAQENGLENVFILPGNGGTPASQSIPGKVTDLDAIGHSIRSLGIELVFVGPEQPLADGIYDELKSVFPGLLVFGPDKRAAMLEASKIFSHKFMMQSGIPTPAGSYAYDYDAAVASLPQRSLPVVIKADQLAAGKGVSIHPDREGAERKLKEIFADRVFGETPVLLQDFMTGTEASLFAICNGQRAIYLPVARDYKRAHDDDKGDNTGGMGSYVPGEHLNRRQIAFIHNRITIPVLNEFAYHGLLYIGVMVHSDAAEDVSVVEFNCRFGDPETQAVVESLEADLTPYLRWASGEEIMVPAIRYEEGFDGVPYKPGYTVNVVVAAAGYPGNYQSGQAFRLPEPDKNLPSVRVIHAGTDLADTGQLINKGGRVLNVLAHANTASAARDSVYKWLKRFSSLNPEGFFYRTDIARSLE